MNGEPYTDQIAKEPSLNYVEIEPITGVMTHSVRSYTMVFKIRCFENFDEGCQKYSQMPFPSLN